jgi:hypothetical protein
MNKFSHNHTVRTLQMLNHLLALWGVIHAVNTQMYSLLALSLVAYWIIGVLGINIGYQCILGKNLQSNWRYYCGR